LTPFSITGQYGSNLSQFHRQQPTDSRFTLLTQNQALFEEHACLLKNMGAAHTERTVPLVDERLMKHIQSSHLISGLLRHRRKPEDTVVKGNAAINSSRLGPLNTSSKWHRLIR